MKIEALEKQLQDTARKIALRKLQEKAREEKAEAKKRAMEKAEKKKALANLFRQVDAHRKIVLGGIVIASGADDLDPAVICGVLLWANSIGGEKLDSFKETGLKHFEERKQERGIV